MANVTYTVKKGDTLASIAKKYDTTISKLVSLNNIKDPNYIVVGQVLIISGEAKPPSKVKTPKAVVDVCGLQSNTERTVYATWTWNKDHTDHYLVKWLYATDDGVDFVGTQTEVTAKQSIYTAPENANYVTFYVKPVSKKYKSNGKEVSYWTAGWSTVKRYYFKNAPPTEPDTPTVEINDYKLTAELDNLNVNATIIQFQVIKNNKSVVSTGKAKIKTGHASYSCSVNAGAEYKVRCRAIRDGLYSGWSEYSDNIATAPAALSGINEIRALSSTSVYIDWTGVSTAKSYEIQYTSDKSRFDSSTEIQSITVESVVSHAEVTGLETGKQWFFRIRAVNDQGNSPWTTIKSIKIGTTPSVPTTWSSTTTVKTGEPAILYWTHNSEDGSHQERAQLEIIIGTTKITHTIQHGKCLSAESIAAKVVSLNGFTLAENSIIKVEMRYANTATNPTLNVNGTGAKNISVSGSNTNKWRAGAVVVFLYNGTNWVILEDNASHDTTEFAIDTSGYTEGTQIKWRVRTRGIINSYSDWSIQRIIYVYAPPTLELDMTDADGTSIDVLTSLPFYISGTTGPSTQKPISYHISITANESYETTDNIGNPKMVNEGEEVYSKYFDTSDVLLVDISAGNISLENSVAYTVRATVAMDSGLTAESTLYFAVMWSDDEYWPDAEISYDKETYTTSIRPFCEDYNGRLIDDITLSVYRREFDGSFTEISKGLENTRETFITDPHPSLDYARYRVVSVSSKTSRVSYYDIPGYPIDEKAVIIQWDEDWKEFDVVNEDEFEQPVWTGSLLRLPYNIDVSDKNNSDVSLVEYIGREHPVSYYGTQLGQSATWNVTIPKSDKKTLYALRRLAIWMGDVYVREPSGSGYWANISVSFSQKHLETTIPVSLEITRVSGGM